MKSLVKIMVLLLSAVVLFSCATKSFEKVEENIGRYSALARRARTLALAVQTANFPRSLPRAMSITFFSMKRPWRKQSPT